jgi:hypothetical protein
MGLRAKQNGREMKTYTYKIIVGEVGNEVGHVTVSDHVSDKAATAKARRLCREYDGDGWWRVECGGQTVATGGREDF